MRKAAWFLALLALGCSNSPPEAERLYCADCKEIRLLQLKKSPTSTELAEIERLQKKLNEKARNLATFHRVGGEPTIELHPGCDCPCHFVPLPL